MNEIWVAVISGLFVGVPSIFATIMLNNKNQAVINTKFDKNQELTTYKINELRKEVEKHNSIVERMALQEQETKTIWKRIDDIVSKIGHE